MVSERYLVFPAAELPLVFYGDVKLQGSEDSALMQVRQHLQAIANLVVGFDVNISTIEKVRKDLGS